jgi:hypothetical protein
MTIKRKNPPEIGDKRIISKFLFVPKEINDVSRWLKRAKIVQEYQVVNECHIEGKELEKTINNEWVDIDWLDKTSE